MKRNLMPFQGWRLTFFQAVMVAVFLLFAFRMYDLQIVHHDDYQQKADANRLNEVLLSAQRGVIFDRYNRPLAINVPAFNVTIIPADLPDDTNQVLDIYNRLSALVGVPPTAAIAQASNSKVRSIEEMVNTGEGIAPFRPVTIAQDIDFHSALQIQEESISLPGVAVVPVSVRNYPQGQLTSHIIGYTGPIPSDQAADLIKQGYDPAYDRIGYDGIENYLNTELSGQRGYILQEVDVAGQEIQQVQKVDPTPGQNVRLTIDVDLQQAAETALENRISLLNAAYHSVVSQQGVVIAMNPQNGQILAMVSYPSYDDSHFARSIDVDYYEQELKNPLRPLYNQAIQSLYPPGSTFKLITASGALQEDVIAPQSELFDPGYLVVQNKYAPNDTAAAQTFVCWDRSGHGYVNILKAIAQSCNVYFYQVGGGNPDVSPQTLRVGGLGIDDLFRYATAYGIGSTLGVQLPGENPGRMPDQDWKRIRYGELWSTGDTYNAALGQGYVTVTPLQLLSMAATVANGGTLYQPTIIDSYLDAEGNVTQPFTPQVIRNVNIDNVSGTITLLPVEDMIMKGGTSLACICENDPDNTYYNPVRCNPKTYRNTVDISSDPLVSDVREYQVSVPDGFTFTNICNPLRFNDKYRPAFVSTQNLNIIREGTRDAVTVGTAEQANLPYVEVAGKTGTAQYCDDVANSLGLCRFGAWPAHAWFVTYAPYTNPEIAIVAFVYNGIEGSLWALPVAVETMEAYYRLKNQRAGLQPPPLVQLSVPTGPATPAPPPNTPVPGGQ